MDGSLDARIDKLLAQLKARTSHDGVPKPGYEQNVASIRACLSGLEARKPKEDE